MDPVVVMGMHRSGTSMVIRMLRRLGVFTGWELDANGEAVFFVLRNRAVLEAQGARWDRPGPIDEVLESAPLRERVVAALERDLHSPSVMSYLGPAGYLLHRSPARLRRPWGWKDPRNTLLLPLWLEIFPSARVVHVVRNGVDVALSLAGRERRRLDHLLGDGTTVPGFLRLLASPPDDSSRFAWAFSQVRLRLPHERLRRRFGPLRIHPIIDPVRGFELWEQYVARADRHLGSVHGDVLRVRYEDVLRDPWGESQRLAAFACPTADATARERAAALVDTSKLSREEPSLGASRLLEGACDSAWLRRLGYTEQRDEPPVTTAQGPAVQ